MRSFVNIPRRAFDDLPVVLNLFLLRVRQQEIHVIKVVLEVRGHFLELQVLREVNLAISRVLIMLGGGLALRFADPHPVLR